MTLHEHSTTLLQTTSDAQVVIFGLEREGISTYQFLRRYLPNTQLILSDEKEQDQLNPSILASLAADRFAQFIPARELDRTLKTDTTVLIYKSAGIPHTHSVLETVRSTHQLVVSSNTELFFQVLAELPQDQRPLTIGITGTKGKSTTTALIHAVCQSAGRNTFLVGNIGEPPLNCLEPLEALADAELSGSIVVLELSSHQLQYAQFSPEIAVLQNITPEHLDYYPDFASYRDAKANITLNQTAADLFICNPTFAEPYAIAQKTAARKLFFALEPHAAFELTATVQDNTIYYKDEAVISINEIPLRGIHNVLNTIPAVVIGKELGLATAEIKRCIRNFQALPHRLQFVAERNSVEYFNDSQGTTPEASIAALKSFSDKPIILIAGGSDKGVDFTELAQHIATQNITALLLFPPTGTSIADRVSEQFAAAPPFPILHMKNMQEAVQRAAELALPHSVVLLSPACASFGLFKNYQDRGNQFIAAVTELPGSPLDTTKATNQ